MRELNINEPITINGDIFIIPNSAPRLKDYWMESFKAKMQKYMHQICELNGLKFDETVDRCVETWYTSPEMECDNIPDHDIHFEYEGEKYQLTFPSGRQLPSPLFKDKKEGDVVEIKVPVYIRKYDRPHYKDKMFDEDIETVVTLKLKLAQTEYRYRSFGNFEDVLKKVSY